MLMMRASGMKKTNISNLYLYPSGRVAKENNNINESASATLLIYNTSWHLLGNWQKVKGTQVKEIETKAAKKKSFSGQ